MTTLVIGVDPGETTGIFALLYGDTKQPVQKPIAIQVHGELGVVPIVDALITNWGEIDDSDPFNTRVDALIAVEAFVVGNRASRSRTPQAGQTARNLIAVLGTLGVQKFSRNAQTVKAWSTDKRLDAAGLIAATPAMKHARDAARHALYAAVHEGIAIDPLSRKAGAS